MLRYLAAKTKREQWGRFLCRQTNYEFYNNAIVSFEQSEDVIALINDRTSQLNQIQQEIDDDSDNTVEMKNKFRHELKILNCLDTLYLSWWASRILMFDTNGQRTLLDEQLMTEAENMMHKLDLTQNDDHLLHVRLVHLFCKLKVKMNYLNKKRGLCEMDKLFEKARKLRSSCTNKTPCLIIGLFFDEAHANINARVKRDRESDLMIADIKELLTDNPYLLENRLVQIKWVQLNLQLANKFISANNNAAVEKQAKEALHCAKRVFNGRPNQHSCRAYYYLGHSLLLSSENLDKAQMELVGKYFEKARDHWDKIADAAEINRNHYGRQAFLLVYNYYLFRAQNDSKSATNVKELYETVFKTVRLSAKPDNLELMEMNLKLACEQQQYSKAIQLYHEFCQYKKPSTLPFTYGLIMKAAKLICESELFQYPQGISVVQKHLLEQLKGALLDLQKLSNGKAAFWFRLGCGTLFRTLEKQGRLSEFKEFREESEYRLDLREDHLWLQSVGSNKSSTTTLQEIKSINIKALNVVFVHYISVGEEHYTQVSSKVNNSSMGLKNVLVELGLPDSDGCLTEVTVNDLKSYMASDASSSNFKQYSLIVVNQYVDEHSKYVPSCEIISWIEEKATLPSTFNWLIINSVLISQQKPRQPHSQQHNRIFSRNTTKVPCGDNMIVSSCTMIAVSKMRLLLEKHNLVDSLKDVLWCCKREENSAVDVNEVINKVQLTHRLDPSSYISDTIDTLLPSTRQIFICFEELSS